MWFYGEAGNRTCDPWFTRHSAYPLHHGGFVNGGIPVSSHSDSNDLSSNVDKYTEKFKSCWFQFLFFCKTFLIGYNI